MAPWGLVAQARGEIHNASDGRIVEASLDMEGAIDRALRVRVYFGNEAVWVVVDDGLACLGGETGMQPNLE